MNFVIIGNSAAGTAAIEAIRKYDSKSKIVQLSYESHPLYSRCLLSYYLDGTIDKMGLFFREKDFHKKMAVKLNAGKGSRVIELDTYNQKVTCASGESFSYDKVLISTGASAQIPANIPEGIKGIFVLRSLTDVENIKRYIRNVKTAVVYGGGLIGLKAAFSLNKCGIKTTVVIRSNHVLSQMIDPEAAQIVKKQLLKNNIDILPETDISDVMSKNDSLIGVKTDKGESISAELLIAAKGVTPNIALIENTAIVSRWGIQTNSYMRTNQENVFAAGDVAEAYDMVIDEYRVNALWMCAVQQGRIAGLNMVDQKTPYNGAIGMNSLNIGDVSLISFGITSPKDHSKYKILVRGQPDQDAYKKIIIDSRNHIKGIILVGKISNAGVLLSLIQREVDVSSFLGDLLSDRFDFGTLLKYRGKPELERYYKI